jgi:hypothetical protein
MRVLVTNDDGVESPGLVALAAGDPPDVVASAVLPRLAAAHHRGAGDDPWEDV